jgi:hypothetical protein
MIAVNLVSARGPVSSSASVAASTPTDGVARPSWADAISGSGVPSLKSTVDGTSTFGPPDLSGPLTVVPASFAKNFSFSFMPHPTHWVSFGNGDSGKVLNSLGPVVNAVLPPHLKV